MPIIDELKKAVEQFPSSTANPKELERLKEFFDRMKREGVVKTPEYDIPRPDTIGRNLLETHCSIYAQLLNTK
jgi:hypothetical protein